MPVSTQSTECAAALLSFRYPSNSSSSSTKYFLYQLLLQCRLCTLCICSSSAGVDIDVVVLCK